MEQLAARPGVHVGRLKQRAQRLEHAIEHFRPGTRMRDIDTLAMYGYLEAPANKPRRNAVKGQDIVPAISGATQRKYLHTLTSCTAARGSSASFCWSRMRLR